MPKAKTNGLAEEERVLVDEALGLAAQESSALDEVILSLQDEVYALKDRIAELEKVNPLSIGDTVVFHSAHSRKVDYPALVQEIFPDGRVRLWIFSVMSAYQQEALEGTEENRWSRR